MIMNLRYFKNMLPVAAIALTAGLSSCTGDLDVTPIDPSKTMIPDEPALYTKCYSNMALQGQTGQGGDCDIDGLDGGTAGFVRQLWNANELTTDEAICAWGDPGIPAFNYNQWDASHPMLQGFYYRLYTGIAYCNHYLEVCAGMDATREAEVRFLRALYYYHLMDCFGNVPFATALMSTPPEQIQRADLFAWIESELLAVKDQMLTPAARKDTDDGYGRADQDAANLLLARMYLNAQVYTGTARWQDAKDMAAKVIGMGYKLHPDYAKLFMQDNTTNGAAADEFIFGIDYDKDHSQSWGGTTTLASAFFDKSRAIVAYLLGYDYGSVIVPEEWNGYHVSNEYVSYFNLKNVTWNDPDAGYTHNNPDLDDFNGDGTKDEKDDAAREKQAKDLPNYTFGYDRAASDKRAFFFNEGIPTFDNSKTESGWRCWKFSGLYSDGHLNDQSFSSMDFPLIRLAEMYLIYAEADARLNGGKVTSSEAKGYIKALRDRAGVPMPADDELTLDWLLAERARELMLEGHRRTDLIRYGYFTSASFPWPYKGGVQDGHVSLPEYRTLYPIIEADLNANTNLVQNKGY